MEIMIIPNKSLVLTSLLLMNVPNVYQRLKLLLVKYHHGSYSINRRTLWGVYNQTKQMSQTINIITSMGMMLSSQDTVPTNRLTVY